MPRTPDRRPFADVHPFRVLFNDGYRYHTNYDAAVAGVWSPVHEVAVFDERQRRYVPLPEYRQVPVSHTAVLDGDAA